MKRPAPQFPIDATVSRRLDRLEQLIDANYEGKPKLFEEKTGIKMAQVNQWFTGYRALRDKALKRLEEKTYKPHGWFDAAPTMLKEAPKDLYVQHMVQEHRLPDAFDDWRLRASPRSLQVIEQLTVAAKKNALREEDWLLIEQLMRRFVTK